MAYNARKPQLRNENSFTSSAKVFSWLSQFINLERGQTPKSFRLDRMEVLVELAGHPERCAPSIHIAGSKGKGSVTGMMSAILEADGHRVARYMSPHVSDFRERISRGDSFFDEAIYCVAAEELREVAESKVPAAKNSLFDPASEDGEAPTFFELLTLYFFLCARHGNCDVMVVETGMGGRLDSTNVVDPLVSVITFIELEHTAFLGKTIPAVAGEKAGIIKPGKPLVLAKQSAQALEVFRTKAHEKNSPLIYFPDIAELSKVNVHSKGTDFTLTFRTGSGLEPGSEPLLFSAPLVDLSIPIPGLIQAENAGLAISALKTAFPRIGEASIRRGLRQFHIPARFETIAADPPFVVDGAHTPQSAALCIETFCSLYGEGSILIFGCAADKDSRAMAEIALPHFSKIIITTPGNFKTSDPAKVYEAFAAVLAAQGERSGQDTIVFIKDTGEAIRQALDMARGQNLPLLGAGSFYLAAEIKSFFQNIGFQKG
ncbi:MAG: bifunctional folylpolyglutamate synthase/dihydrofolate synthase [Treponema sp.]|jgi:dihydrofolate synthase/folylpolyglutamate synthase|nr:bifunctional folylpolyglutamate synthase/dihydrofolate synthase [Treponema sp.]